MATLNILLAVWFILLSGPTRTVTAEEIRVVVDRFVYGKLGRAGETAIEYRSVPTRVLNVPLNAQLRVVADPTLRLRDGVMLPVEVYHDNRVEHTFIVSIKIRTYGTVLRASVNVDKGKGGEAIAAAEATTETTTLPGDVITDSSVLAGKRTKRMIRQGAVLTESMFENIPLVNQGDLVTLLVRTNSVLIKARAVAREDGGSGDVVLVEKEGSRDRLKARILDRFTVELIAQN
jgi:flagella basal body P-ring formation protein FlgA